MGSYRGNASASTERFVGSDFPGHSRGTNATRKRFACRMVITVEDGDAEATLIIDCDQVFRGTMKQIRGHI